MFYFEQTDQTPSIEFTANKEITLLPSMNRSTVFKNSFKLLIAQQIMQELFLLIFCSALRVKQEKVGNRTKVLGGR